MCVPAVCGGVYTPPLVIVPEEADPPATPSTDQVTVPLVTPNDWVWPKVSATARGVTANPVPVPDSAIVCGVPGALSAMVTEELRAPVVVGAKVILMVQGIPGCRVAPQLFVSAKSPALPPDTAIPPMARVAPPILVRVTGWAGLVDPVDSLPKLMVALLRLTSGSAPPLPTGVAMSV